MKKTFVITAKEQEHIDQLKYLKLKQINVAEKEKTG